MTLFIPHVGFSCYFFTSFLVSPFLGSRAREAQEWHTSASLVSWSSESSVCLRHWATPGVCLLLRSRAKPSGHLNWCSSVVCHLLLFPLLLPLSSVFRKPCLVTGRPWPGQRALRVPVFLCAHHTSTPSAALCPMSPSSPGSSPCFLGATSTWVTGLALLSSSYSLSYSHASTPLSSSERAGRNHYKRVRNYTSPLSLTEKLCKPHYESWRKFHGTFLGSWLLFCMCCWANRVWPWTSVIQGKMVAYVQRLSYQRSRDGYHFGYSPPFALLADFLKDRRAKETKIKRKGIHVGGFGNESSHFPPLCPPPSLLFRWWMDWLALYYYFSVFLWLCETELYQSRT